MGTLAVTYNGTTKNFTMSSAPVIAYGGNTLVSAGSWTGTKTLSCAGKWMTTDVTIGTRALSTKYTWAKSDIQLTYTKASASTSSVVTATTTITVPEGYNRVQFFACGGGGGSASGYTTLDTDYVKYSNGAAGGGGYTKEVTLTTTPGTQYTLSIGPGGSNSADGTDSIVYQGSTEVLRAGGGKASTESYGHASVSGWWHVYSGSGGSGGGAYGYNSTTKVYSGAGGTNGGDGANATSGTDYSRGKGQGTTTKCSFLVNSPAYGGGGGSGYASYNAYQYYTSSAESAHTADAMASTYYKRLVGGTYGGGHGTYTYMSGVYFDHDSDGEDMYDYTPRCINGTSGTFGSGGGAGGGARRYYDPANGYPGWAGYSGAWLSGGSGVIIYRFYEA